MMRPRRRVDSTKRQAVAALGAATSYRRGCLKAGQVAQIAQVILHPQPSFRTPPAGKGAVGLANKLQVTMGTGGVAHGVDLGGGEAAPGDAGGGKINVHVAPPTTPTMPKAPAR